MNNVIYNYLIIIFIFNQRAFCTFCLGLGRQRFRCAQCKLLTHRNFHKLGKNACTNDSLVSDDTDDGDPLTSQSN
jgi:hypothetical protein